MARNDELQDFIDECRQVGLADVKALEAAWEECADLVGQSEGRADLRSNLISLLKLGVEYSRFADAVERKEVTRG